MGVNRADSGVCSKPDAMTQPLYPRLGENKLQTKPPMPMGGDVCQLEENADPYSNTGSASFKSGEGCNEHFLIDYLSFTYPKNLDVYNDEGKRVDTWALTAQDICERFFPDSPFFAEQFQERGRFGYLRSASVYLPDCDVPVGIIAEGGNQDTVLVSITGSGIAYMGGYASVYCQLERFKVKITRLDIAFDDFLGEYVDYDFIQRLACENFFGRVHRHAIDDLQSGNGRSIYLGKKGLLECNIYEKGLQLQSQHRAWKRVEVRTWANQKYIPLDALMNLAAFFFGAFPWLYHFVPRRVLGKRPVLIREKSVATALAMEKYVEHAFGKTLNLILQSSGSDEQFVEYVKKIAREGAPSRFKSMPQNHAEIIVGAHIERKLNEL